MAAAAGSSSSDEKMPREVAVKSVVIVPPHKSKG